MGIFIRIPEMRRIARYVTTFRPYLDRITKEGTGPVFEFEAVYHVVPADLRAALEKITEEDPTLGELYSSWFGPFYRNAHFFGMKFDETGGLPGEDREVRGLALTEDELTEDVMLELQDTFLLEDEEDHVSDHAVFSDLIDTIDVFSANRGKQLWERQFSRLQEKKYMQLYGPSGWAERARTENEIRMLRKFTDDLAEQGDLEAMEYKAYSCYGGNDIYECDWETSRELLGKLYEATDDPAFAASLGNIYYYGRTGSGPDYDRAFTLFVVSAANGSIEGRCRLGDMFLNGYGCRRSEGTARSLYENAYNDSVDDLVFDGRYDIAEPAFRMGELFRTGTGMEQPNPDEAYRYYLQAALASDLRAESGEIPPDSEVDEKVTWALEQTRELMPEGYFRDQIVSEYPWFMKNMMEHDCDIEMTVQKREDGDLDLTVTRKGRHDDPMHPLLLTFPAISWCTLTDTIRVVSAEPETSFCTEGDQTVRFDDMVWEHSSKKLTFFFRGTEVGWIVCREYRLILEDHVEFDFPDDELYD